MSILHRCVRQANNRPQAAHIHIVCVTGRQSTVPSSTGDAAAAYLQVNGGRDGVEVAGDRLNYFQVPGRPGVAHAPQHLAPVRVGEELAACHSGSASGTHSSRSGCLQVSGQSCAQHDWATCPSNCRSQSTATRTCCGPGTSRCTCGQRETWAFWSLALSHSHTGPLSRTAVQGGLVAQHQLAPAAVLKRQRARRPLHLQVLRAAPDARGRRRPVQELLRQGLLS